MENQDELARAAQEHHMATGRSAAVDDLTTAIMTGASPAEISRLEASAGDGAGHGSYDAGNGADDEQGDAHANSGGQAGDLPQGEPRNAERIRLTGLEERDKGLVNAANIIARTERIPFDEAWQRVNGIVSHGHGNIHDQQGGDEAQGGYQQDGGAYDEQAQTHEALKSHCLNLASDLYSDLKNPGSAHWQEANRIATDPSHPDHDPHLLLKPHAPLIIAKLAAANLGIRGAAASGADEAFQPGSNVRPAGAMKQSAPPLARKSNPEMIRASEQAALDAIEGTSLPPAHQAARGYLRL